MNFLRKIIKRTFNVVGLASAKTVRSQQQELLRWKKTIWEPGHYYSPQPDISQLPESNHINYEECLAGVDLNEKSQVALLEQLSKLYSEGLFPDNKSEKSRYYFRNDYFGYSDGIFLNTMMRHFKPKRIIEVGSGYSSALMLDTNENFLDNRVRLKFIEPYPEERLLNLIETNDNCELLKAFVQDVSPDIWSSLEADDILFIDSSHVSKYKSDVNYLFFEVIPNLKPGVIIHIHDVFFPFEYPIEWLKQGRAWTEAYLLRSFLQFNSEFEILLFTSYMEGRHTKWFQENMPACLTIHKTIELNGSSQTIPSRGQSIYIRRKMR